MRSKARELFGPAVLLEQDELTDADSLARAFRAADTIFLLVLLSPLVQGTRNVVRASHASSSFPV